MTITWWLPLIILGALSDLGLVCVGTLLGIALEKRRQLRCTPPESQLLTEARKRIAELEYQLGMRPAAPPPASPLLAPPAADDNLNASIYA